MMFALVLLTCASAGLANERRLVYSYNDSDRVVSTARFTADFPFLVSLSSRGSHFCGGTLLDERWILSAAHCFGTGVASVSDTKVRWISGSTNATLDVDLIVAHPEYHMDWLTDDIALLRLAEPLSLSKYAKLESTSRRHVGSKALIAGWGTIDEGCTQVDDVLREGDTYITGSGACGGADWTFNWTELICTNHINSTNKAVAGAGCGDSGGPLFLLEDGEMVQVGLVSYTASGRDHFTRVFTYMDWITKTRSSPPTQSQMARPRCFNGCCDDPDWLDSYGDECHTWKNYDCLGYVSNNAGLLEKCKATCLQCPSCKATNQQCCDVGGYVDPVGESCSSWQGYSCTSMRGWISSELLVVRQNCPKSCGLCPEGTDCADEDDWLDAYGFPCHSWRGHDCSQATVNYGYADSAQAAVLQHCPLACGACNRSSSPSVSTSPSTTDTTIAFDVARGFAKIHYMAALASIGLMVLSSAATERARGF